MRRFLAALLAAALAPAAAFAAADPGISATVEAIPGAVTLSRPAVAGQSLTTFAAYKVTVTNGTTNTLNRVFFNATAVNIGSSEALVIDSTVPAAACTIAGSTATCSLPSLAAGASSAPFFLIVRAPFTGSSIQLNWLTGGDEGNGGGNGCCDLPGSTSTALVDPTTDTSYRRKLDSFVKPGENTFFTGDAAISTTVDGWTTRVVVPGLRSLQTTTAAIFEDPVLTSCASYALAGGCYATTLTIPGSFDALQIEFRWDKSLYKLAKPELAKLFYTGLLGKVELALCSADALTYGSAPTPGRPCFAAPPRKLGSQDTPIKEQWGDLLFQVKALDNGVYEN